MISIGGGTIKELRLKRSWGVYPSTATGVAVDGSPGSVDSAFNITAGGVSFHGVLDGVGSAVDTGSGTQFQFRAVDNRYRLQAMLVFGAWNVPVRRGDPEYSGTKRRWKHLLPANYDAENWSITDAAMSTTQVLQSVLDGATPAYSFSINAHSSMDDSSLMVEAMSGRKVADVVSQIVNDLGIDLILEGASSLRFDQRGVGAVPSKSNAPSYNDGEESTGADTKVTVVGGRNLVQANGVRLEAAWASGYEKFISEPAWIAEVERVFGAFPKTRSGYADRAAKAREVTLREYYDEIDGGYAEEFQGEKYLLFLDNRRHGSQQRNDLPVWRYINEFIFKSYAVASDQVFSDVPLNSKDLFAGLIHNVKSLGNGQFELLPNEYYPDSEALVVAKGQPVDFASVEIDDLFRYKTPEQWAQYWGLVSDFSVMQKERVILFRNSVFKPGTGQAALYILPNKSLPESDLAADSPMRDIAVPNPLFTASPAEVRASLTFDFGRFKKVYGSGRRHGSVSAPELATHLLAKGAEEATEVPFEDGLLSSAKAAKIAETVIDRDDTRVSGSFTNRGSGGVPMLSTVRDATIIIDRAGLSESISYEKERGSVGVSQVALQRITRVESLDNRSRLEKEEVEQLKAIAKIERSLEKGFRGNAQSVSEALGTPVSTGGNVPVRQVASGGTAHEAGSVIYLNKNGEGDASSSRFGGVLVSKQLAAGDAMMVAHSGTVPTRVKGSFKPGDRVGVDNGDDFAKVGGSKYLGTINEVDGYTGSAIILARVNISGGADTGKCPLKPIFEIVGSEVKVTITPTYLSQNVGGYGSHVDVIPQFNDIPIIGEGVADWIPPSQSIVAGAWALYLNVFHGKAKLILQETSVDPPERKDENQVYKIAGFSVVSDASGVRVTDPKYFHCPHFNSGLPYVHEAYPYLYNVGTAEAPDLKIRFSPASVTDVDSGKITVVSNVDEVFPVESGDKFFLKHEVDANGITQGLTFVKEASPTTTPFVKGEVAGTYYRKISEAKTDDDGNVFPEVHRSFGIDWYGGGIGSSSSSSAGSSSSSSGSMPGSTPGGSFSNASSSSGSGSGKNTAVVPAPWLYDFGYTHVAYFSEECPEVIFSDWFSVELKDRVTRFPIDHRFVFGTVDDSIRVVGLVPDKPWPVAAYVDGDEIVITRWPFVQLTVTGRMSGVRMGFDGVRYPGQTEDDFEANERFWSMSRKKDGGDE